VVEHKEFSEMIGAIDILWLALGIAGNTAIFSIIDTLMIKPLPYPQADRLSRITELYPKGILEFFQPKSRTMEIAFVSPIASLVSPEWVRHRESGARRRPPISFRCSALASKEGAVSKAGKIDRETMSSW
jgi:hypothetical protein